MGGRRGARGRGKKKRGGGGGGGKSPTHDNNDAKSGGGTDPSPISKIAADSPPTLDVGTRVKCPNIASEEGFEDLPCTGTVVGHLARDGSRPEGPVVRLDSGKVIFSVAKFFEKSNDPPYAEFNVGSRVECKLGNTDAWFPGTVLQSRARGWARRNSAPYLIGFDYGRERHFWGPPGCIRASGVPPPQRERKRLRFKAGDRVECSCEGGVHEPGTVIKTWYGGSFENGHTAPYQIQLDSGSLMYAPFDDDMCIRKSDVPAPDCWICFDNEQSENNLIVRECACRGRGNGFVHVQCLVRLAMERTDMESEPDRDTPLLFNHCLTCRQGFDQGSHCHSALTRAFYNIASDYDIDNTWNKMACTAMSELLRHEKKFDGAIAMLQERITMIRSRMTEKMHDDDNHFWIKDLSNFLLDLADVHESTESYDEMKEAIEESLLMTSLLEGVPETRKAKAIGYLAKCAVGKGDFGAALEHTEKAISLLREEGDSADKVHLSTLLSFGGELNIELNNEERGLALISESMETLIPLYGREHDDVRILRERLDELTGHG